MKLISISITDTTVPNLIKINKLLEMEGWNQTIKLHSRPPKISVLVFSFSSRSSHFLSRPSHFDFHSSFSCWTSCLYFDSISTFFNWSFINAFLSFSLTKSSAEFVDRILSWDTVDSGLFCSQKTLLLDKKILNTEGPSKKEPAQSLKVRMGKTNSQIRVKLTERGQSLRARPPQAVDNRSLNQDLSFNLS